MRQHIKLINVNLVGKSYKTCKMYINKKNLNSSNILCRCPEIEAPHSLSLSIFHAIFSEYKMLKSQIVAMANKKSVKAVKVLE